MLRRSYIESESRLQIRLIEARERQARVHRHEQRVDIFAAVVSILIPDDRAAGRGDSSLEIHRDYVLAAFEMARGQDDVAARLAKVVHDRTVDRHIADGALDDTPLLVEVAEIQNQRIGGAVQLQPDLFAAFDPGRAGDEIET